MSKWRGHGRPMANPDITPSDDRVSAVAALSAPKIAIFYFSLLV